MAKAILLLSFLVVNSQQISADNKEYSNSDRNISPKTYLEELPSKTPVRSTPQVFEFEKQDRAISESSEVYGSSIDDLDLPDYDIVLGQRIDFQNSAVSKNQRFKNEKNTPHNPINHTPEKSKSRGKRSLSNDEATKAQSTANPLFAKLVSKVTSKNATLPSAELSLFNSPDVYESSGDGELSNASSTDHSILTPAPRLSEADSIKNRRIDKNFTIFTEDGKSSKPFECEGDSCWEPSPGETNSEEVKNAEKAQEGLENSSQIDKSDAEFKRINNSVQSPNNSEISKSNLESVTESDTGELSSPRPDGSTLTIVTERENDMSDKEGYLNSLNKEKEDEKSEKEDFTITQDNSIEEQENTSLITATTNAAIIEPNNEKQALGNMTTTSNLTLSPTQSSVLETTEMSTANLVHSETPNAQPQTEPQPQFESTITGTFITESYTTEPSTPESTTTEASQTELTDSATKEPLTTDSISSESPPTQPEATIKQTTDKATTKSETTLKTTTDTQEESNDTRVSSNGYTSDETTSTTITTDSDSIPSATTMGEDQTLPTPTTTMTTPNTTMQIATVTVPQTPSQVLNGACNSRAQEGEDSSELQRCQEISNADCINGTCQCLPRWYQLGDSCRLRLLEDSYQPDVNTLEDDKTSIDIKWLELPSSQDYDRIEYTVRWTEVSEKSDPPMRRSSSSRLVRSATRSESNREGDRTSDLHDDNVLFTNETSVVIEKLIPGMRYLVKVTALVMMKQDGRREELWYPAKSFRLEPSCLIWSPKQATVIPQNKTVVIAFQSLEGNYKKCYINLKAKNYEGKGYSTFDCRTFTVKRFEFGKEYTLETRVTAGTNEDKDCTSSQILLKENKIPDSVCTLEVTTVSSEHITVVWEPPCAPYGYLTGYAVTLKSKDVCNLYQFVAMKTDNGKEMGETNKRDVEDYANQNQEVSLQRVNDCKKPSMTIARYLYGLQTLTITGLRAGTSYDIRVTAINNMGRGNEATNSVTTLTRVPGSPSEFLGVAIGESTVRLAWKPPRTYPGPTDYVISVFQFAQGDMAISNPPVLLKVIAKGYNNDSIEIKNLRIATVYRFEIVAKTSKGKSEKVSTEAIQTWELPSYPVENLQATDTTNEGVTLTWDTPPQGNGRTRAYTIIVKTTEKTCAQALVVVNDQTDGGSSQPGASSLNEVLVQSCPLQNSKRIDAGSKPLYTRAVVNGLEANTDYLILVAPYNGAGLGQVEEKKVKTKNAVPKPPASFSCSATSNRGEINVRWTPPEPKPGDTTYTVTLAVANDYEGRSFSDLKQKNIEGYIQDHIYEKGLLDFWQYKAYLIASTPAGDSTPVETDACRTIPAVPGEVAKMSLQYNRQNSTQLEVEWDCPKPEDRHGILENFLLQITASKVSRSDIKLADIGSKQLIVPPTIGQNGWPDCSQPYISYVHIIPQVTYVVSIKAKVKGVQDHGPPLEREKYAHGSAPPPFPKLGRVYTTNTKQQQGTFKTTICPTCFLNSEFGQIIRYGLGVCQTGFCDFGSRRNHSLGDYDTLVTWRISKENKFKIAYKIFDDSLERLIKSEAHENHDAVEFVVGNQVSCVSASTTEFCNGPLPPGTQFRVFQFSCTSDGCTESDLSEVTATPAAVSTTASDTIVIGGAASGVAVALIIILVIVIIRIRLRKVVEISDLKEGGEDMQLSEIISSQDPVTIKSRPIKIKDFEENLQQLHANNNDLFSQEFTELDMDSTVHPTTIGSDPQYRKHNRWSNILPYDHTRVKLKVIDGDEMCSDDYINANFLVGYRTAKDYIATQGPLTATIADFWRMVWEQESSVIVMLSAFQEKDPRSGVLREKVAQYYPDEADNEGSRHDHLLVSWRGKLDLQAWEVRTFHITHLLERRHRYVKHFFFKSWTDHKADISPHDLISFVNTVREEAESHPPGPIVVHCSAGVGRTGTFIAVDYFCRYIKDLTKGSRLSKISDVMGSRRGSWAKQKSMTWEESTVDIYGRIIALRDCRRYMVQTKSQYAFIYDTVMELIRQASRVDDTSESGNDTESCLSVPTPAAGTSATNDVLYDDVEVLKRPHNAN